jgi:two-component system response regulator LytT
MQRATQVRPPIMLNIIVVEDEALVAKRLMRFLAAGLEQQPHNIRHVETLDDAQEYLSEKSIDLLILDLNLNGQDGFDLLKTHLSASYNTIVVSANTDRALEAFELGVLDFVAKPFKQERIDKALQRALGKNNGGKGIQSLSIEKRGRLELVALTDISHIRAAGHYSEIIMKDGSEHLHNKNLSKLLYLLPSNYQQVHRSNLVALDQVDKILKHAGSQYELMLGGEKVIPLGRSYYSLIKKALEGK